MARGVLITKKYQMIWRRLLSLSITFFPDDDPKDRRGDYEVTKTPGKDDESGVFRFFV